MNNFPVKITQIGRDKFYFDQYEYCVQFYLQDCAAIRAKDHQHIDDYMEGQQWRRQINHGGSWRWESYRQPITPTTIKNCHTAHDNLKTINTKYKLIVSYDYGYLYLNSIQDADTFIKSPGLKVEMIKQVIVNRPKGSIIIKSAKHDFRTYFKNQRVEHDQKDILVNFLKGRKDIRLGPALTEWTLNNYRYVCDNYFIDHNDDGFLTMLALVSPIKIKKTLTLLTE